MSFEAGDEVIVYLKRGISPIGTYSKLKMNKFSPCRILRNFDGGNSYEFELPNDVDISPIFNIADLYKYHELDDEIVVLEDYTKKKIEEVEYILDQRIAKSTRGKDYYEYLLMWKNRPMEDASWIS